MIFFLDFPRKNPKNKKIIQEINRINDDSEINLIDILRSELFDSRSNDFINLLPFYMIYAFKWHRSAFLVSDFGLTLHIH